MDQVLVIPTELFSIILSYADTQTVKNFCNIYEYKNTCESNYFWYLLFANTFPEYVIQSTGIYNYQNIYFGLHEYPMINDYSFLSYFLRNYLDTFKYLLETNQLRPIGEDSILVGIMLLDDVNIFNKYFLGKYQDFGALFYRVVYYLITGPNIFNYLYTILGKTYNLNDLAELLPILPKNEKIVKYILDKIPVNINADELYQFFSDLLKKEVNMSNFKVVWKKYRHQLSGRQQREISDMNRFQKTLKKIESLAKKYDYD